MTCDVSLSCILLKNFIKYSRCHLGLLTLPSTHKTINSLITGDEIADFANSVAIDEMAPDEPPHLNLHCLPSRL